MATSTSGPTGPELLAFWQSFQQAGAEFGQAQQLVFAVKDRLSLRYGSVRNLLLKHNPNRS